MKKIQNPHSSQGQRRTRHPTFGVKRYPVIPVLLRMRQLWLNGPPQMLHCKLLDGDFGRRHICATIDWPELESKKYRPGVFAAIFSMRSRARDSFAAVSIHTGFSSGVPEKMSKLAFLKVVASAAEAYLRGACFFVSLNLLVPSGV
jgi:hypothetical protein